MTDRTWQDNAAEFAALDRGEGWPFARLVACSVAKDNGNGNRNARNTSGKVSAREFAEVAATSAPRVLRYLAAWQAAASRGWVTDADQLTPADTHRISDPDKPWAAVSKAHAPRLTDPVRREALSRSAEDDQVGLSKVLDIASNPKAMAAAIKGDPEVAQAARHALDQQYANAPKPVEPSAGTYSDPVELTSRFRRLHTDVDGIIRLVIEGKAVVTDAQRDAVLAEVKWLRTALGYIEDGVQAGSLDQALNEMLAAES